MEQWVKQVHADAQPVQLPLRVRAGCKVDHPKPEQLQHTDGRVPRRAARVHLLGRWRSALPCLAGKVLELLQWSMSGLGP